MHIYPKDSIPQLQTLIAEKYGLTREDLLGARRTKRYAEPRRKAIYLCHTLTGTPSAEIGKMFCQRQLNPVATIVGRIECRLASDTVLAAELAEVEAYIAEHMPHRPATTRRSRDADTLRRAS